LRKFHALFLPISICILAACAGGGDSDAELRALIESAEAAAEERDTNYFRGLISVNYVDARGRDRQQLIDFIRGYLFLNARIEVMNRVREVTVYGDDAAKIALQSALIGRRDGRSIPGTDGSLYDIELELARESGDWKIIGAQWERTLQ
jgi:hypothetical protein